VSTSCWCGHAPGVVEAPELNVVELVALLLVEEDLPPGNLVDNFLRVEQRHRVVGHDLVAHAAEFLLALRHDVGDQPVIDEAQPHREHNDRRDHGREADAGGLERDQFAVGGHAAEDDHDRRKQSGGDGQREDQRHAEEHELRRQEHGQVGVHQHRELAEERHGHEQEGQHADNGGGKKQDLLVDIVVNQVHAGVKTLERLARNVEPRNRAAAGPALFARR